MRIAIVENEAVHAKILQRHLLEWSKKQHAIINAATFTNCESFLDYKNNAFDLVFMDIQMDGIDGLSAAHRLRDKGFEGQLVFLTAFPEYVFDGYNVQALNYLLKPVAYEKIAQCLDFVDSKLNDDHYTFRNHSLIIQIPYSQILYFSSANHYTKIITSGNEYQQLESIRNIYSHLPEQFHFCHRTAIVNIEHVVMLRGRELTLTDHTVLPVSLTYLQDIRYKLLSCADSMR